MEPPTREEWGPLVWRVVHLQSLAYADEPTDEDKLRAKTYYEALFSFLPCPECMEHFKEVLAALPIDGHLDSPKQLIDWTHAIHNRVNQRLGKPEITKQEFYKLYANDQAPGRLRDPSYKQAPVVQPAEAVPQFAKAGQLRAPPVPVPAAAAPLAPAPVPARPQPKAGHRIERAPVKAQKVQRPARPVAKPTARVPPSSKPLTAAAPLPIAGRRMLKIGPPKAMGARKCANCR